MPGGTCTCPLYLSAPFPRPTLFLLACAQVDAFKVVNMKLTTANANGAILTFKLRNVASLQQWANGDFGGVQYGYFNPSPFKVGCRLDLWSHAHLQRLRGTFGAWLGCMHGWYYAVAQAKARLTTLCRPYPPHSAAPPASLRTPPSASKRAVKPWPGRMLPPSAWFHAARTAASVGSGA